MCALIGKNFDKVSRETVNFERFDTRTFNCEKKMNHKPCEAESLAIRVNEYLQLGGLFNPETVDHEKVQKLLIDCREYLYGKYRR